MKIAVTGGSGFVGRHVLSELTRRGISARVSIRDDAVQIADHDTVLLNLHEQPSEAYDRLGAPDVVLHLAWYGLPNYRSLHHFESELPAQYQFLSGLVRSGLKKLVVAGTCFEYGFQSGPLSEDLATSPSNPYGFAKDALRRQLQFLMCTTPYQLTWARLFYMYGSGQSRSSLFEQIRKAVADRAQTFPMSGGEQLRDFMPVQTVASELVDLTLCEQGHGIVNVCSGRPTSVRSLVESWIEQNGWSIKLDLGRYPYPDHEPMAFWGNRRKLDIALGPPKS